MSRLVLDASAGVDLVLLSEAGEDVEERIAEADLHTVAHFDAEVFSALARLHRSGAIEAADVAARLDLTSSLDITRAPITARMLREAWSLRVNVAARDSGDPRHLPILAPRPGAVRRDRRRRVDRVTRAAGNSSGRDTPRDRVWVSVSSRTWPPHRGAGTPAQRR